MILGAFIIYKVVRNPPSGGPSEINILGSKLSLKGPAWLVMLAIGVLMLAAPLLVAAIQRTSDIPFQPPASATVVSKIADPDYHGLRFIKDISELDLRESQSQPWYTRIPGWQRLTGRHTRIRPATLINEMLIEKVEDVKSIHINYSTSGILDLRCLTHPYKVNTAFEDDLYVGEIVADVANVPIGKQFTLITEVTYWNAFSGAEGDDYTTYTHNQTQGEEMSVMITFPESKAFKAVDILEQPPDADDMRSLTFPKYEFKGPLNKTYYWSTTTNGGRYFFTTKWKW